MRKLFVALLALLVLAGCSHKQEKLTDGERFKSEYESLNGQSDEDGNKYSTIEINADCTVKYLEARDVEEAFTRGTHVIYLGWPECGWCRRAIPVLVDTINEYSGIVLYTFNIKQAREDYVNGLDNELTKMYKDICTVIELSDVDLDEFDRVEDGTLKLPSSMVYFISNGELVAIHKRTVDSHLDSYEPLTDSQINELSDIYRSYIDQIVSNNNPGCSSCD